MLESGLALLSFRGVQVDIASRHACFPVCPMSVQAGQLWQHVRSRDHCVSRGEVFGRLRSGACVGRWPAVSPPSRGHFAWRDERQSSSDFGRIASSALCPMPSAAEHAKGDDEQRAGIHTMHEMIASGVSGGMGQWMRERNDA